MRKKNELLKRVFSLVIVAALIVTGVPTAAFYAKTTTIDEGSNETNSSEEKMEKEDVLEEYQQYVEDGLNTPEWIQANLYWLTLVGDNAQDFKSIYDTFHESDFRTSKFM